MGEKERDKNILKQSETQDGLRIVTAPHVGEQCGMSTPLTLTWIRRRPLTNCPRLPIRDLKIFDVDGSGSNPDDSSNSVWELWPAGPVLTRHTTIQVHQVISTLSSIFWKEELHSFLVIAWFSLDAAQCTPQLKCTRLYHHISLYHHNTIEWQTYHIHNLFVHLKTFHFVLGFRASFNSILHKSHSQLWCNFWQLFLNRKWFWREVSERGIRLFTLDSTVSNTFTVPLAAFVRSPLQCDMVRICNTLLALTGIDICIMYSLKIFPHRYRCGRKM